MANLGCQFDTWGDGTLIEELFRKNGLWACLWDLFLIANWCQRAHLMDDATSKQAVWAKAEIYNAASQKGQVIVSKYSTPHHLKSPYRL